MESCYFFTGFKSIDFFFIYKPINILTITMQTQEKFCLCFIKTNISFFSGATKLPLIPKVSPSPKIKKSFLRLSVWGDELLSFPKIITFLSVWLLKP